MDQGFFRTCKLAATAALFAGLYQGAGPASAAATATVYDCDVAGPMSNWITPKYFFIFPDDGSGVLVLDGLIYHFNQEQPKPGKVQRNNDKGFSVSWTLMVSDHSGKIATIHYTADYQKAANQVMVRGIIPGFTNTPFAGGTCKITRE